MDWLFDNYTLILSVSAIVGLIAVAVFVACLVMMIRDRRAEKRARGRG